MIHFEALRLHDIENYELMGHDFSNYLGDKKKVIRVIKVKWIILPPAFDLEIPVDIAFGLTPAFAYVKIIIFRGN